VASLNAHLNLEIARFLNQFDAAQNRVNRGSVEMDRRMAATGVGFGAAIASNVARLLPAIGALKVASEAVAASVQRQSLEQGLAAVSAEDVGDQLARLREMADDPAMEFESLVRGSTRLQAVGMDAKMSEGLIREMGNALALVGGTDLDGVLLALSQIASKGKVQAEEINQIAERVPQIRALLSEAFGTADTEDLQKMGMSTDKFFQGIIQAAANLPRAVSGMRNDLKSIRQDTKDLQIFVGNYLSQGVAPAVTALRDHFRGLREEMGGLEENVARWIEELRIGKDLVDQLDAERAARETDYEKVLADRRAAGFTVRDPEMEAAVARAKARAEAQIETLEQKRTRESSALADEGGMIGVEGLGRARALEARLDGIFSRVLSGTGMEEQGRAGLEAMVRGLNTAQGRDRQAVFIEALEEALKIEQEIANLRKASAEEMAGLREQVRSGAFRLLSPAEQAAQLREQIGKSLGVDIGSANDLAAGLRALQEEAKAAAASGDVDRERSALERLRQAQEDAAALAAMGDRSGEGRGGELSPQNGEGARLVNMVFGRSAGDNAAVSEAKAQTTVLRSVEGVLREIRDKQGSGESDFFTDLPR
jgi:tape measure domain-containing protein